LLQPNYNRRKLESAALSLDSASQQRDAETSFDFFFARYYTGRQGRFHSPDPFNAGADLTNPQSWNAYTYVQNDPLTSVDPDGLESCPSPCSSLGASNNSTGGGVSSSGGFLGWLGGFSFWQSSANLPRVTTQKSNIPVTTPNYDVPIDDRWSQELRLLGQNADAQKAFIWKFAVQSAIVGITGGTAANLLGFTSGSGLSTVSLVGYVPFSLTSPYASGPEYQPLIRELDGLGRLGQKIQLNTRQIRALTQNVQDVLNNTYQTALRDPRYVQSLRIQAQLGRWRYLNQLPAEAQAAFRTALSNFGINIPN
jgi:RHS repeat-associated protein